MVNIMTFCRVVIRAPKLGARVDGDAVLLVARGGDGRLARAAAVELGLDVGFGEGEARRAVLDDAGDGLAVRLSGAGYSCLLAGGIAVAGAVGNVRRHTEVVAKGRHDDGRLLGGVVVECTTLC